MIKKGHLLRKPGGMICVVKAPLPRWDPRRGWVGGNSRTLYAFTDKRTRSVSVLPGGYKHTAVGDYATVRATAAEARKIWGTVKGWKVSCPRAKAAGRIIRRGRRRR